MSGSTGIGKPCSSHDIATWMWELVSGSAWHMARN